MPMKKEEIKILLEKYGRSYYNSSLTGQNKIDFLKTIKSESFPGKNIGELEKEFDYLYNKFQACKKAGKKSWEFYELVERADQLANIDFLPKIILKRPLEINNGNNGSNRQKSKVSLLNGMSNQENKNCIEVNLENRIINAMNVFFKDEILPIIKSSTSDIIQKNDKRLDEIQELIKTLHDEQQKTNKALNELTTVLKSTIAGQKVLYETDLNIHVKNKNLLEQILEKVNKIE